DYIDDMAQTNLTSNQLIQRTKKKGL
ncbi:MAG: hypothetical protein RLZZ337_1866, partial [Bacteroidota bacterium]